MSGGWANARAVKRGNLGLTFAAVGGFCFALWPCISSCVEGQTQWGNAFATQLNASDFFFVYAACLHASRSASLPNSPKVEDGRCEPEAVGALLAALLLLPLLCQWPLHSGRERRESCAQKRLFCSAKLAAVQGVSLSFWSSYLELRAWNHFLGLAGGFAHGCGSMLSLQAGHSVSGWLDRGRLL